jgi:pyrimidine oxygenase
MLDEVASVPGTDGVLLTFDDFLAGMDAFGERIQPLMRCRAHIAPLPGGGLMITLPLARNP